MQINKNKPYVIYMAEIIYENIVSIKKNNPEISNIDAVEGFIGTSVYENLRSGKFHNTWFNDLEKNKFIDNGTGKKIPPETIQLLKVQKDITMKQLIEYPEVYYPKSTFPLEVSQRAFDYLWRVCESYELWCKESNQLELISLNVID